MTYSIVIRNASDGFITRIIQGDKQRDKLAEAAKNLNRFFAEYWLNFVARVETDEEE